MVTAPFNDFTFFNLIDTQIYGLDSIQPPFSDLELQIGPKSWFMHKWIWSTRLIKVELLTDDMLATLKKVSLQCARYLLLWLYTDDLEYAYRYIPYDGQGILMIMLVQTH